MLGVLAAAFAVAGLIGLWLVRRKLRRVRAPEDGDLWETLRGVPFGLVVALDLLDLGLDVLASPITWFVLDRFGLGALKKVAVTEAFIPGTQLLPTMTVLWLVARRKARSAARPPPPAGRTQPV